MRSIGKTEIQQGVDDILNKPLTNLLYVIKSSNTLKLVQIQYPFYLGGVSL